MQGVTLGGTGKSEKDRHPKIRDGVLIGAGAIVLGNIVVGECARVAAGSVAAWLIVTRLMTLGFAWQAGSAAVVVLVALIVTVGLGLAGTLVALSQKPASVLRNL